MAYDERVNTQLFVRDTQPCETAAACLPFWKAAATLHINAGTRLTAKHAALYSLMHVCSATCVATDVTLQAHYHSLPISTILRINQACSTNRVHPTWSGLPMKLERPWRTLMSPVRLYSSSAV